MVKVSNENCSLCLIKKFHTNVLQLIFCLQVSVSGLEINFIQNVTDSSNVEDCSTEDDVDNNFPPEYVHENTLKPLSYNSKQTGCASSPCLNKGQCYPLTPTDYSCSCLPGFTGINCATALNQCDQLPCQNQGVCKENNTHYTCDCLLGFTGLNCDQSKSNKTNESHYNTLSLCTF